MNNGLTVLEWECMLIAARGSSIGRRHDTVEANAQPYVPILTQLDQDPEDPF